MKNLPALLNDSSYVDQFNKSQFRRDKGNLLFTIKIAEIFELHASMPGMPSAGYQTTVPQKLNFS